MSCSCMWCLLLARSNALCTFVHTPIIRRPVPCVRVVHKRPRCGSKWADEGADSMSESLDASGWLRLVDQAYGAFS